MIVTTIRIERPQGTVVATGIPVQIDQASLVEAVEFEGARPFDIFRLYTLWPPYAPNIIQRRDMLVDLENTDAETGALAQYRVSGLVETFDTDHQEAVVERIVGA